MNRVAVPALAVRRNAVRKRVSSAWRPNSGESSHLGTAGAEPGVPMTFMPVHEVGFTRASVRWKSAA